MMRTRTLSWNRRNRLIFITEAKIEKLKRESNREKQMESEAAILLPLQKIKHISLQCSVRRMKSFKSNYRQLPQISKWQEKFKCKEMNVCAHSRLFACVFSIPIKDTYFKKKKKSFIIENIGTNSRLNIKMRELRWCCCCGCLLWRIETI